MFLETRSHELWQAMKEKVLTSGFVCKIK
jgi:hypothetical protein